MTAPAYDDCRIRSTCREYGQATGPALSPREGQVLRAIAAGHTVECTARQLHLSVSTIRTHRMHLLDKLHAVNGAHAVAVAYSSGLLTTSEEI